MESPIAIKVTGHSPNCSAWTFGEDAVTHIVVHTPEASYGAAIRYLKGEGSQASYHLLVREDGCEATQLVPFDRKAWHALSWNSISEGVSLAGRAGSTTRTGEKALAGVVAWRCLARGIPPVWDSSTAGSGVCRHGDLQADRSDPMTRLKFVLFMLRVKRWHRKLSVDQDELVDIRGMGPSFWTWRAWRLGLGPWDGNGRADCGAKYRPRIPRRGSPRWAVWFAKLAGSEAAERKRRRGGI